MAAASNMLDEEMFSVVIWALLWATVFAPFVFRYVLNSHIKARGLQVGREGLLGLAIQTLAGRGRWRGAPTPEKAPVPSGVVVVLEQTAMENAHSLISFKVQPRKFGTTTANMYQGFLSTVIKCHNLLSHHFKTS